MKNTQENIGKKKILAIILIFLLIASVLPMKAHQPKNTNIVILKPQTKLFQIPEDKQFQSIQIIQHNYQSIPSEKPKMIFTPTSESQPTTSSKRIYSEPYTYDVLKKGKSSFLRINIPKTYYQNNKEYTTESITFDIKYSQNPQTFKMSYEPETAYEYVIITNDTFLPIFENHFQDWKEANDDKIDHIYITNISDITSNSNYWVNGTYGDANATNTWMDGEGAISSNYSRFNDTQAQIRNFLRFMKSFYNIEYVLIGGNKNAVPPRMICSYAVANCTGCKSWENDTSHASDMYYACLHYSMNSNENERFMENDCCGSPYDQIDWGYDLCVGRVLVSNAEQLYNWINKTKAYTNGNLQGNYLQNFIVAAKNNGGSITNDTWVNLGGVFSASLNDEFPENITFLNNKNITQSQWSIIDDYVNGKESGYDGFNIIYHAGHGGTLFTVYKPVNNFNELTPNFLYTEGCNTGDFGTDTASRAEAWCRDNGSCFGLVTNSASGWFGGSTYYTEEFANQMFDDNNTMVFCRAHNDAREIIGHDPDCIWGMIVKETNFIGDPALEYNWFTQFAGGSGSRSNPYQISKIEHLYNIRNYLDKNFTLINDLDFEEDDDYLDTSHKPSNITGSGWLPIGNSTFPFTGSFNGDNHTINNLFINRSMTSVGLFGVVGETEVNTEIYNIGITNANVSSDGWSSALAGYVYGYGSYINNSYSTGYINTTDNGAGGLIGYVWYATISNCYSNATIDSMGNLGGLVGIVNTGTVKNSFSYGSVTDNNPASSSGGFIGHAIGSNTFSNNFFDNQTSGFTTSDGAIGKYTFHMKTYGTYNGAGWDIEILDVNLNNGYPYLSWQNDNSSSIWKISNAIQIINISGKTNSSYIYYSTPIINWSSISDDTSEYWLQIANDSVFSDIVINITHINEYTYPAQYTKSGNTISFVLPTPLPYFNKKYYIRVGANFLGGS